MENSALVGLIAGAAGLIGAIGGVAAIFWGLGFNEYLGGKKKMPVAALGKEQLKQRLFSLNSQELAYEIKPSSEADLALEWKIVDARWYALFAKERLRKTYRAFIVLDELRRSARYYEEMATVQWMAGAEGLTPRVAYQNQFFKGRILFQKSWGVQYGIKKDGKLGKVYEYNFDVDAVRNPLKKVIEESGWEFVPVVRKEHATYKSFRASA